MIDSRKLREKLRPQVRVMQIVVGAMVAGPLVFAVVTLMIGSQAPAEPAPVNGQVVEQQGGAFVGRLALVVGVVAIFAQGVAGRVLTDVSVKKVAERLTDEPERLGEAYQAGLVVSAAINEGAAFFNLIAYMVGQSPWNLAMAGLLALSIAVKLPSVERVAVWVEQQVRRIAEGR